MFPFICRAAHFCARNIGGHPPTEEKSVRGRRLLHIWRPTGKESGAGEHLWGRHGQIEAHRRWNWQKTAKNAQKYVLHGQRTVPEMDGTEEEEEEEEGAGGDVAH
uniref:Uncharacterized protein n=1 Tax=Globodera rostochiensis TaxID=31243 RepID=A0A914I6L4_GLORO